MRIEKIQANFCIAIPVSDSVDSQQIVEELRYQLGGIKMGLTENAQQVWDIRIGKTYRRLPDEIKAGLAEDLLVESIDCY